MSSSVGGGNGKDLLAELAKHPFIAATLGGLGAILEFTTWGSDFFFLLAGVFVLRKLFEKAWYVLYRGPIVETVHLFSDALDDLRDQIPRPDTRSIKAALKRLELIMADLRSGGPYWDLLY